jgi:hypothetical protein
MSGFSSLGWILIVVGLGIAGLGLVLLLARSVPWLGRLPGDIRYESDGVRFYFPLVTCLLLSAVLTLVLWLVRWFRG